MARKYSPSWQLAEVPGNVWNNQIGEFFRSSEKRSEYPAMIHVVAVMHNIRKPGYWLNRL